MKRSNFIAVFVCLMLVAIFTAEASAMYNPATGRFLQRDPGSTDFMRIGAGGPANGGRFIPTDPAAQYRDGMNLHQYVLSNPLRYSDPRGTQTTLPAPPPDPLPPLPDPGAPRPRPPHDLEDTWNQPLSGEGTPCCGLPANMIVWRTDSGPDVANARLNMSVNFWMGFGQPRQMVVWWRTCLRLDNTTGIIPGCTNSLECSFGILPGGDNAGAIWTTVARFKWQSCENGVWRTKWKQAGRDYHFDRYGNWWVQNTTLGR